MTLRYLHLARRALGRPPSFVARRALQEVRAEAGRFLAPRRARRFGAHELVAQIGVRSIGELWSKLAARRYVSATGRIAPDVYKEACPGDSARIFQAAERALRHRVNLLGSGEFHLGARIDWHRDYKSGHRWTPQYCRDIDYMDPGRPSDVKFPWELSRMQWLIPVGQAYLLGADEKFAEAARRIIDDWIDSNPFAASVNWSCPMEAAMRIIVWTWLFHAFSASRAWSDEGFRTRFLCSLYLHADFTDRYFEFSDVNGNHCDANAAGLVFAGLFFGGTGEPGRWLKRGWSVLSDELERQVSGDGVDFEGSVPYHRLVTELFFLPALYRLNLGFDVKDSYKDRVRRMAWFTEAYTRPDGSAPCWGDSDDGRALGFGGQQFNDHRYLIGWVGQAFKDDELTASFSGDTAECVWLLGASAAESLPKNRPNNRRSRLFREGGYAVLRNDRDHVFVDCGPVGMGGRGGHGHNDVLSCEVFLDGCHLITDCGTYVYTADYDARNRFRSTAYHNTPCIDGEEINRFVRSEELWWFRNDAQADIRKYETGAEQDVLVVSHTGYRRLAKPVVPVRTYVLDHGSHSLLIKDEFEGLGSHRVQVPLHLARGVSAERTGKGAKLRAGGALFLVEVLSPEWDLTVEPAELSASYGHRVQGARLIWRRAGALTGLTIRLMPG